MTGLPGATGATGATGPGAQKYLVQESVPNNGETVSFTNVDPAFTLDVSCADQGGENFGEADLQISTPNSTGTFTANSAYVDGGVSANGGTAKAGFLSANSFLTNADVEHGREVITGTANLADAANGNVVTLNFSQVTDEHEGGSNNTGGNSACSFYGTVIQGQ